MTRQPKPSRGESPTAQPAPPPNTPRPITAAVRWQSLKEPRVRFWSIAFLFLLAIAIWFFTDQLSGYNAEKRLIGSEGRTVVATILDANNDPRKGGRFLPGTPCDLKFEMDGKPYQISGAVLTAKDSNDYVEVGAQVTLHVNPDEPSRQWTDRSEPEPLARRMIALAVIVPAAVATFLAAALLRRRAIQTWHEGFAEAFAVVDTYHNALAPRSHAVHCAAASGRDQQIITVYLPARLPRPQPGDLIWLIHPPQKPKASIAAAAYEG